jgi:hypothetical protein
MLNIGRFMLSTLTMCLSNTIMSSNRFYNNLNIGSYLARLLEENDYIDFQKKIVQLKINPKMVFIFHKNNLEMFKQLKIFIDSGFFKTKFGNTMRLIVTNKQGIIKLMELINGSLRINKSLFFVN